MGLNIYVVIHVIKLVPHCSSGLLTHNNDSFIFILVTKIEDWLRQPPDTHSRDLFWCGPVATAQARARVHLQRKSA